MDLQDFRSFLVVAEELNFSRAAKRLGMSQPPLSRQIARIEEEFGSPLFFRTTRSVSLTPVGEVFVKEAKAVLARVDTALRVTHQSTLAEEEDFVLHLGLNAFALHSVLPSALNALRAAEPRIEIENEEADDRFLLQKVRDGGLDAAFLKNGIPARRENLEFQLLVKESTKVILPASHPLANVEKIKLQDLSKETFILHAPDEIPILHSEIITLCKKAGFSPKIRYRRGGENCMTLATTGKGILFSIPTLERLKTPGLRAVSLVEEGPEIELVVAWKTDTSRPILRLFLEFLRQSSQRYESTSSFGCVAGL
jgi:LysR family transcriptional regulator, benzoate and cis,cis-muconate-responsive activator of ben and cat genes